MPEDSVTRTIWFMEAGRPIHVVLLENQTLLRTSLSRVFSGEPGFTLLAECAAPDEALQALATDSADVVILSETAQNFVETALRAGCRARFLVMAESPDPRDSARALKVGVSGIFLKSESAARLLHAVKAIAEGEVWIDPRVLQGLASRFSETGHAKSNDVPALTEREYRVLEGIVSGLSNRKIGDCLTISEGSVKAVVQQLFEKTGVRTRSQLVRIAMERSLTAVSR